MTRTKDKTTIPSIPQEILEQRAALQDANLVAGYDLTKVVFPTEQSIFPTSPSGMSSPLEQAQAPQRTASFSPIYQPPHNAHGLPRLSSARNIAFSHPDSSLMQQSLQISSMPEGQNQSPHFPAAQHPLMPSLGSGGVPQPTQDRFVPQSFVQSPLAPEVGPTLPGHYPIETPANSFIPSTQLQQLQSRGLQRPITASYNANENYGPSQVQMTQHSFVQSPGPNGETHEPQALFPGHTLKANDDDPPPMGSCCHGTGATSKEQSREQHDGIYYLSQHTATTDNPMTEQRFRQLQSQNPGWQRQPTGMGESVHECNCRDCMCTACPVHPFNPAMNQQMQDIARSHPQQFMQMAIDSSPFTVAGDGVGTVNTSFRNSIDQEIPFTTIETTAADLPDQPNGTNAIPVHTRIGYINGVTGYHSGPIFNTSSHRVFQYDNAFTNSGLENMPYDGTN